MKPRVGAMLLLAFTLAAWGFLASMHATVPKPPNVVLISVDGCRADHLGAYGYGRSTSPCMDRLSREGVTFLRSYSQANESLFSHASLFSSRYPGEIAVPTYTHFAVPPGLPTLPKRLKASGYQTAAFTGGGHLSHAYGFGDGYDVYYDEVSFGSFFYSVPRALLWLQQRPDGPFFMFLHGYDCHRPYRKPGVFSHMYAPDYSGDADRYLASTQVLDRVFDGRFFADFPIRLSRTRTGEQPSDPTSYLDLERLAAEHPEAGTPLAPGDVPHIVAHYDAAITYADTWLGEFMAGMTRLGLDRTNTMVIVVADHGEDLMEHGMFNHRFGLQVPNLHVPLIFWGAGIDASAVGQRYDMVTQNLDVAPTVLSMLGKAPLPDGRGTSLFPLLAGVAAPPADRPAYAEGILGMTTVLDGDYQLIARGAVPGTAAMAERIERAQPADGTLALFDLHRDPQEKHNLAGQPQAMLALADRVRLLLAKERLVARARAPALSPVIDEKLRRKLQQHGYW